MSRLLIIKISIIITNVRRKVIIMDEELLEEYESLHDFNLLDLIDDEDAIMLADCSSYELEHNPKCIEAMNRLKLKKSNEW
jgi:hypothetical protein